MNLAAIKAVMAEFSGQFSPAILLARDLQLQEPSRVSANGSCHMIKTKDGWIAANMAREEDVQSVPAWLEIDQGTKPWQAVEEACLGFTNAHLLDRALLLGMPVSTVGETPNSNWKLPSQMRADGVAGAKVIDMSALWAGPLCGGLLADLGAQVSKWESTTRPDPTPFNTPMLDKRINGKKQRETVDFSNSAMLLERIAKADVLITNARPLALSRIGLSEVAVFQANPRLIWIAITAHGWREPNAMRVGFGDDCAAAGGLVEWKDDAPHFVGDAIADPLTGTLAAAKARDALLSGHSGLIDVNLAQAARWFAQHAGFS